MSRRRKEQRLSVGQAVRNCARLYSYALRHWKLVVASVLFMLVFAGSMGTLVYLVRPIIEAAMRADVELADIQAPPAAEAAPERQEGRFDIQVLKDAKARLLAWGPVKRVMAFIGPDQPPAKRLWNMGFVIGLVLAPLLGISAYLHSYLRDKVVFLSMADIRLDVFRRLLGLSMRFFNEQRSGELISRLTNDILQTRAALTFLFGDIILQPLMLFVGLWLAWRNSHLLFIATFLGSPIIIFVMWLFGKRIRRYGRQTLERLADLTDAMSQMFGGIRTIKAFHMEDDEVGEFDSKNQGMLRKIFKLLRYKALGHAVPEFFIPAGGSIVLIFASLILKKGTVGLKDIGGFTAAAILTVQPIKKLTKAYTAVQESLAGAERIFALLDAKTEIVDSPDAKEFEELKKGIRFDHVWFGYNAEPVLKDIDFFAPTGRVIAVVGKTGAGKSTMLDLIPRFYDPAKGAVLIDDTDIRQLRQESLLSKIAVVSQHPFLFNRSIEDNIRYGKRNASMEEIVSAAKAAYAHDFVANLPEKYATVVGERGVKLSGGERQRITIARAILKDAPILLLDEATSSLDSESERLVQEALSNLMKNRTVFVIAHRLSTVRNADTILVLSEGRIVEQGTHEELVKLGGEYHRLYQIQFSDGA